MKIEKAKKLIKKVNKLILTNEYNLVKVNGVSLSRSDLEDVSFYSKKFIENNGSFGWNLMNPVGNVKKVLDLNDVIPNIKKGWY